MKEEEPQKPDETTSDTQEKPSVEPGDQAPSPVSSDASDTSEKSDGEETEAVEEISKAESAPEPTAEDETMTDGPTVNETGVSTTTETEEEDDSIKDKDLIEASQSPRKVRKFKQTGRWLVIFFAMFFVSLPLTVFLAMQLRGPVVRHVLLQKLDEKSFEERQKGLNFIVRRFAEDHTVREDVLEKILNTEDPVRIAEMEEAIRLSGAWGPDLGAVWVNYQGRDLQLRSTETRATLAILLGQLGRKNDPVIKLPETKALLWTLAKDKQMLVRREALAAAVQMTPEIRQEFILHFVKDENWQISSEAWIFVSLVKDLKQMPTFPSYEQLPRPWSEPEKLEVTRAILVAMKAYDPNAWKVILQVASDEEAPMALRGYAYTLLKDVDQPEVIALGVKWITAAEAKLDDPNLFLAWRGLIGLPVGEEVNSDAVKAVIGFIIKTEPLLIRHEARIAGTAEGSDARWLSMEKASHLDAARAAAISRIAPLVATSNVNLGLKPGWSNRAVRGRYEKAFWESLPPKTLQISTDLGTVAQEESWPRVILALAGRAIKNTTVNDMETVFRQTDNRYLTQTADALGQALDEKQTDEFIKKMIGQPFGGIEVASLYDEDRIGTALMVALGYGGPERFAPWMEEVSTTTTHVREPVWKVAEYYRMAEFRYQQGTDRDVLNRLRMRSGTDISREALALVLMRRGNLEGFEILFNHVDEITKLELRDGESQVRLWELLGHYRLWMMMRDCLPVQYRDLFETYGDPELQDFHTIRLRAWYLMYAKSLSFDIRDGEYKIHP